MSTLLEDKDAIRELLHRYCHAFDESQFDAWLDLFTEDFRFLFPPYLVTDDKDGLRRHVETLRPHFPPGVRSPSKHCVFNEVIEVHGDRATVTSYVVVVGTLEDQPLAVHLAGRYEDELVRADGRWLFRVRKAHGDILGPMYVGVESASNE